MTIKTLLAVLTDKDTAAAVMQAAALLARRHDAHLIVAHPLEALDIYPGVAVHIPESVYESFRRSQAEQSTALKEIFTRHTHAEDFVSEWRLLSTEAQTAADRIAECARSADAVVMPAVAPGRNAAFHGQMLDTVIRTAGRPVIVVPADFKGDSLGRSVLIGWNGTREAVRAAHDTLALMQEGDKAHILRINDRSHAMEHDATTADLAAAFARHGIETTLAEVAWETGGVAEMLNRSALEKGADMIAVGAFGHSLVYDFIVGAATRDLLRHLELPVLFSR
ncbi:universal stress protein [Oceaniglobus roseus]|uniref:universal stress protein n=1 Tax=Oceaniglobus roseus TaxID=1737570 RepID=UPI000C7EF994|nr:universal stress protein [Kandeliimicrobium roseum]